MHRKSPANGTGEVSQGASPFRVAPRLAAFLLIAGGCVIVGQAFPASATPSPGGSVTVHQTCGGWDARVDLNHKVAPFRTVEVFSTIPGHPGITDGHFDSTFGPIWMANGTEHDISATVDLTISAGTNPVVNVSAVLVPAEGCPGGETTTTTEPCLDKCGPVDTTTTSSTTTTTLASPLPGESTSTTSKVGTMAYTGAGEDLLLATIGAGMIVLGLGLCRWSWC